jgi:chromosome segregation ATPase
MKARPLSLPIPEQLQSHGSQCGILLEEAQRKAGYFSTEIDKLDLWAEDLKNGLELRIKELESAIKESKRASKLALQLEDKLALQKQVKDLEQERNQARRRLYDAQDEIDAKRDEIIGGIEEELRSRTEQKSLFSLRWLLMQRK